MDLVQKKAIALEFEGCVERTVERIRGESGYRPFHSALLSDDALFWSKFERSFSTSFGQRVIEKISEITALAGGANEAQTQFHTRFSICKNKLNAIDHHISQLRDSSGIRGNWDNDVQQIAVTPTGNGSVPIRVISDLWWKKHGVNHYMSIKTVKPNIDQTAEAKKDLLKLKMFDPNCRVYFGLYYNPYGEIRESYMWSPPKRVFDFAQDSCVLIGQEYWDTLGGPGTYQEILEIASEVGTRTRKRLKNLSL
ncbi:TdeIII family type II restriction endonuclease [Photobacterium sp. 2_MG-2023]|uniref:TdeIII family type II restriction endonuclease n=1 Tax=Photobacterium sp. 2_MG-2023 TaxID=3062663 RepID=UPI0026E13DFD|nr:TdeIII family type II restriction endonuclease [Photobacterium sp. 2_MG-2023]MDO6580945.1 TdeIII family type II restriction endonuclease [Photobacterium sp. 2_MG-2023]